MSTETLKHGDVFEMNTEYKQRYVLCELLTGHWLLVEVKTGIHWCSAEGVATPLEAFGGHRHSFTRVTGIDLSFIEEHKEYKVKLRDGTNGVIYRIEPAIYAYRGKTENALSASWMVNGRSNYFQETPFDIVEIIKEEE